MLLIVKQICYIRLVKHFITLLLLILPFASLQANVSIYFSDARPSQYTTYKKLFQRLQKNLPDFKVQFEDSGVKLIQNNIQFQAGDMVFLGMYSIAGADFLYGDGYIDTEDILTKFPETQFFYSLEIMYPPNYQKRPNNETIKRLIELIKNPKTTNFKVLVHSSEMQEHILSYLTLPREKQKVQLLPHPQSLYMYAKDPKTEKRKQYKELSEFFQKSSEEYRILYVADSVTVKFKYLFIALQNLLLERSLQNPSLQLSKIHLFIAKHPNFEQNDHEYVYLMQWLAKNAKIQVSIFETGIKTLNEAGHFAYEKHAKDPNKNLIHRIDNIKYFPHMDLIVGNNSTLAYVARDMHQNHLLRYAIENSDDLAKQIVNKIEQGESSRESVDAKNQYHQNLNVWADFFKSNLALSCKKLFK